MRQPLSPEFRLVCAACRWPRGEARDEAVREAAAAPIDWDRLTSIIRRQRVWGLAADGLAASGIAIPQPYCDEIPQRAEIIRNRNRAAVALTARLASALDAKGIDWISFKGLTLAARAYGNIDLKMSTDIDLLVPQQHADAVFALLAGEGYERFNPGPDVADHQVAEWMRVAKEVGWRHEGTRHVVEVHGRMMANPALLPEAGLDAPRQHIRLAQGLDVPTLADPILYAYLVAHGAHHGWFRLKWLVDVAALLSTDLSAIEAHHAEAERLGVGRCSAQALLLAHDLLGLPLDSAFERRLRGVRAHRRLVAIAMGAMADAFEEREHANPAARTLLPVTLGNLLLRRGLGYKFSELAALASNPTDRAMGRLPRGLGFLYPVLGGVRWSARMTGLLGREAA